jgi:WD40 repeat protein
VANVPYSVTFSHDGKRLAIGDQEGYVSIWEVGSWKQLQTYSPTPDKSNPPDHLKRYGAVDAVAFSPDDKQVLVGQHAISIWHPETGDIQVHEANPGIRGPGVYSAIGGRWVSFAADGSVLFGCDPYGKVTLWHWPSKKKLSSFETGFRQNEGAPVAMSPDAKLVATTDSLVPQAAPGRGTRVSQQTVYVRDAKTGKVVREIEKDKQGRAISSVAFSPDGKVLGVGLSDGTVRLYGLESESDPVREFRPHRRAPWIVFSPDGSRILTVGGPTASIWPTDVGAKK